MTCTRIDSGLPIALAALFAPQPIVADRDHDGVIDAVTLRIGVARSITHPRLWAAILNLTARLAFVSVASELPLVTAADRIPAGVPLLRIEAPRRRSRSIGAEIGPREGGNPLEIRLSGSDPVSMARLLDSLDTRTSAAESGPDGWRSVRLQAETNSTIEYLDGSGRVLQRRPLRADAPAGFTPVSGPTVSVSGQEDVESINLLDLGGAPSWFVIDPGDPRTIHLGVRLHLASDRLSISGGMALARAVVRLAAQVTRMPLYPVVTEPPPSGIPVLRIIERPTREGQPAEAAVVRLSDGPSAVTLQGGARALSKTLEAWFSAALCQSGPRFGAVQALRKRVADFKTILEGDGFWGRWAHVLAAADPGEKIDWPAPPPGVGQRIAKACRCLQLPVPGFRTEKGIRRTFRWRSETDRILEQVNLVPQGSGPLRGTVWVSKPEALRKRLAVQITAMLEARGYTPDLTVCNAYKPGLCWLLEHILPQLKQHGPLSRIELDYQPFAASQTQLELRSRWLQEIFPGPDLLAQALNLDPAGVHLTQSPDQMEVYRLRAWSEANDLLMDRSFSPLWQPMPYRLQDPAQGFVHPTTAGFRLQSATGLHETRLPTDRQLFWIHFQQEWLPQLEARMRARLADGLDMKASAFWERIRIEVAIDETDERLDLDRERICPMEALHEDLYFFLLNAFQHFAAEHQLPDTLGLGAVLPVVAARTAGQPMAALSAEPLDWPRAPQGAPAEAAALISLGRAQDGSGWEFGFSSTQDTARTHKVTAVARVWGYPCRYATDAVFLKAALPGEAAKTAPPARSMPIVATTRYLPRIEADALLDALNTQANLHVWTAGRSLRGRTIRVVEAYSVPRAAVISVVRLRLLKPTLLINARHHANEISGTPAALRFLIDLAGGRLSELLQRANVACIPMENIDGVEHFEAIYHQGRDHKLHAARYNAVGAEFYADYFKSPPRFGEAAVKPLLWRRWLPQLMVDLHGVPGHEWDQPFAGYTPARFEQFWIPNTFVYAILPFLGESDHPLHPAACRLVAAMRQLLGGEEEIVCRNRRLAARYRRYARRPEPDIFPAADHDILTVLPPLGRTRDVNFARHYPRVTESEIVVEVPDEGSDGRSLHLCVQAHYKIQEALLGALGTCRSALVLAGEAEHPEEMVWRVERITPDPVAGPI